MKYKFNLYLKFTILGYGRELAMRGGDGGSFVGWEISAAQQKDSRWLLNGNAQYCVLEKE